MATGAPRTYVDGVGDASGELDINKVSTSYRSNGRIRFTVGIPSYQRLPPSKMMIILIDTDHNPRTGSANGSNFAIWVYGRYSPSVSRWGGPDWTQMRGATVGVRGLTVEVDRSTLGYPSSFDFSVQTKTYAGPDDDRAPNTGSWRFTAVTEALRARVAKTWTASSDGRGRPPTAGQPFTYAAAFRYNLTGKILDSGQGECGAAFVRGRAVPPLTPKSVSRRRIDGTSAFVCKVPTIGRAFRGALLKIRLSVIVGGRIVAQSTYSERVR